MSAFGLPNELVHYILLDSLGSSGLDPRSRRDYNLQCEALRHYSLVHRSWSRIAQHLLEFDLWIEGSTSEELEPQVARLLLRFSPNATSPATRRLRVNGSSSMVRDLVLSVTWNHLRYVHVDRYKAEAEVPEFLDLLRTLALLPLLDTLALEYEFFPPTLEPNSPAQRPFSSLSRLILLNPSPQLCPLCLSPEDRQGDSHASTSLLSSAYMPHLQHLAIRFLPYDFLAPELGLFCPCVDTNPVPTSSSLLAGPWASFEPLAQRLRTLAVVDSQHYSICSLPSFAAFVKQLDRLGHLSLSFGGLPPCPDSFADHRTMCGHPLRIVDVPPLLHQDGVGSVLPPLETLHLEVGPAGNTDSLESWLDNLGEQVGRIVVYCDVSTPLGRQTVASRAVERRPYVAGGGFNCGWFSGK